MKKHKSINVLTMFDLIDEMCPEYQEIKIGSTPESGMYLWIKGRVDGKYMWQTTYTRNKFNDGRPCTWRIGRSNSFKNLICDTFAQALELARNELQTTDLPVWRE